MQVYSVVYKDSAPYETLAIDGTDFVRLDGDDNEVERRPATDAELAAANPPPVPPSDAERLAAVEDAVNVLILDSLGGGA